MLLDTAKKRAHCPRKDKAPGRVQVKQPHGLVHRRQDSQAPAAHRDARVARQQHRVPVERKRVAHRAAARAHDVQPHVLGRPRVDPGVRVLGLSAKRVRRRAHTCLLRTRIGRGKRRRPGRPSSNDVFLVVSHQAKVAAQRIATRKGDLVQRLKERLRRAVAPRTSVDCRAGHAPHHQRILRSNPKAKQVSPRAGRKAPRTKAEVDARERVRRHEPRPQRARILPPAQRVRAKRPGLHVLRHADVPGARAQPLQPAEVRVSARRVAHAIHFRIWQCAISWLNIFSVPIRSTFMLLVVLLIQPRCHRHVAD